VRKTPCWPRSWANLSVLYLSHRLAWANLHLLGQPDTLPARDPPRPLREREAGRLPHRHRRRPGGLPRQLQRGGTARRGEPLRLPCAGLRAPWRLQRHHGLRRPRARERRRPGLLAHPLRLASPAPAPRPMVV
jgi:hypothetical protein